MTSYGWISAATPSNRIRRSRRMTGTVAGRATSDEPLGDRFDDGATDLAADLFPAIGDREGDGEDRLGGAPFVGRGRVAEQAREHPAPGGGLGPFAVHDRSRQETASRTGIRQEERGLGHQRIRLDRGVHDGAAIARRILEAHRTSALLAEGEQDDLGERREPVDRPMGVGDRLGLSDRLVDGVESRRVGGIAVPRASATSVSRAAQAASRSLTYDHSSSISSPRSANARCASRARRTRSPTRVGSRLMTVSLAEAAFAEG